MPKEIKWNKVNTWTIQKNKRNATTNGTGGAHTSSWRKSSQLDLSEKSVILKKGRLSPLSKWMGAGLSDLLPSNTGKTQISQRHLGSTTFPQRPRLLSLVTGFGWFCGNLMCSFPGLLAQDTFVVTTVKGTRRSHEMRSGVTTHLLPKSFFSNIYVFILSDGQRHTHVHGFTP